MLLSVHPSLPLAHNFIWEFFSINLLLGPPITSPSAMFLSPRQDDGGFKLYHYDPTIPGAIVIAIAFGITTAYHIWQLIRTRCWMALPIVIGGFRKSSTVKGTFSIIQLTNRISANHRLRRTSRVGHRIAKLDSGSIYHSSHLPARSARALRRHDIHAVRQNCDPSGREATHSDSASVDH